jgi:stage IV sporulation protein FB
MNLFQPPPLTRYDLRFRFAGVPVRVHPLFWLMALLFGASAGSLVNLLVWIVVLFISILGHELGHAFAMRMYGIDSRIVLHLAGGLTIPESVRWGSRRASVSLGSTQSMIVSFAGPFAGFLLAGLVILAVVASGGSVFISKLFGVIPLPMAQLPVSSYVANLVVMTFLWINVFWGLINLMPVYPLDGGDIAREALVRMDPRRGLRTSLLVSAVAGLIIALLGLTLFHSMYIAFLFGILAIESYQAYQAHFGNMY